MVRRTLLKFRNLGLVTPCPRLASVFYENRNIPNLILVPPTSPLSIWTCGCSNFTLSTFFISFFNTSSNVLELLFSYNWDGSSIFSALYIFRLGLYPLFSVWTLIREPLPCVLQTWCIPHLVSPSCEEISSPVSVPSSFKILVTIQWRIYTPNNTQHEESLG